MLERIIIRLLGRSFISLTRKPFSDLFNSDFNSDVFNYDNLIYYIYIFGILAFFSLSIFLWHNVLQQLNMLNNNSRYLKLFKVVKILLFLQRRYFFMLCRLAAAAPYIASVICFIGATVTLGHAAIIEEVSQDSDAASSQQKVNGSNPQGATVVTPAHSFPAFLEPRVVFEQGTPLNNYIKSLMRECEETICDIRKDEVSYDPSRITTILDNQIEYLINSFLLRKIQHPDRC